MEAGPKKGYFCERKMRSFSPPRFITIMFSGNWLIAEKYP
jgi:hypothetical protein